LKPQLCIYCNHAVADTVDHIPPKLLLAKPYPDNLLIVPSCFKCNSSFQKHDEYTRVIASIDIRNDKHQTVKVNMPAILRSHLAVMLKDYIGNRTNGFLFHTDSDKPLLQRNILRDGLNPILTKLNLKQNGKAFHSFRRFRVMHLRKNRVPWDLEKFWIGHANKDVTDKYAAQLKEDVEWRKDVAEKTGLGFALPARNEISIGQLGQPEAVRSEEAKAA